MGQVKQVEQDRIVRVMIARNPSYPRYGVIAVYADGRELWDCDCASNREADTLAAAAIAYPDHPILLWDHPDHYCQVKP